MFLREVLFADRSEAGCALAQRLLRFKDERPVVLALPRGGVPVGFEVARALEAPLDLILVRKIGAPFQPELALGAVVDGSRPPGPCSRMYTKSAVTSSGAWRPA
jgi:putative phosphoribosyl transferase